MLLATRVRVYYKDTIRYKSLFAIKAYTSGKNCITNTRWQSGEYVLQILGIINQRITNTKWQILQINVFEIKEYEDSRTVESKYI
jgi:hypothetical protein